MNCPVCDGRMRVVQKHGVEVDICPDCKGVWLDRGELEKIIDMVSTGGPAGYVGEERYVERPREERPREERPREEYRERPREERHYDERDRGQEKRYDDRGREIDPRTGKPRKRRESWFEEIFDVFGD